MSSCFPQDVYLEILIRLPVKSIYVCKCVCMLWYQRISSPSFSKMHLNHAKQRNNTSLMFKSHDQRIGKEISIRSISYDSLLLSEINDKIVEIDCPVNVLALSDELVGSCNGLVCFRSWNEQGKFAGLIWNPATKVYRKIPNSANRGGIKCIRGFAYNQKANDYKVISIVSELSRHKRSSFVDTYTLRSNSWKGSRTVPYKFGFTCNGVLVNGALHWFVETHNRDSVLIVSLDTGSGRNFDEVQQTKELLDSTQRRSKSMGVLDECLCVIANNFVNVKVCFEVWVMQDYGIQESWTKRHNIIPADERIRNNFYLTPMWSFRMGGEILLCSDAFNLGYLLYDPKHESIKEINLGGIELWSKVDYFESLVPLNSGAYVGESIGRWRKRRF